MVYTFTCSQGHDPVTFTAEAENDDEAVAKLMEEARGHLAEVHPDLASMSPDQTKQVIISNWTKSES
ncbi:hypothetical protein A3D07_01395 [Candidatus Curtissbacteria bacterium RIFCSPHIGHO2_02_FULL_42_15]|uniref:DUF1059 domain-containing protein n=1 Tax=Candidatus Curtissbacteria bacterium RIFCSPHIGHO2_02_FULL_42_15 TaxID=1797716 RepID=A0A1F5GHF9_9BACT|nr:MAG: hypothetical protein A3D07_01395 [Candidatus Curtissbacteria bacterium RIFCSPHIGHO2_02_FULL_42_15]